MSDTSPQPAPPTVATPNLASAPLTTRSAPRAGAITPEEWALCLELLREKGPDAAKVMLSRGRRTADGRTARSRTLHDLIQREPYKGEWDAALAEFVSKFSNWMHESALKPEVVERYDPKTGNLVERRTSRRDANWAALMVLRRYSAEWRDRKALTVDGEVKVNHTADSGTAYRITASEVLALEPGEQDALFALLEKIEGIREENRNGSRPREIIDARPIEPEREERLALPAHPQQPGDSGGAP